ncbi:MAG: hypothetical protein IKI73_07510 [Firmicutes bacterium]|nr:hypothetical protein [Bacillota bacterium]
MEDNISLFDLEPIRKSSSRLDVAKMEFLGAETMTWKELFSGFDKLYAITFSSGISFVYQLVEMFKQSEVIFGCENVMSYSMNEVMAYQQKLIDSMKENAGKIKFDLISRIEDGTLRFYVARKKLSHEKIYLLEAEDGRKRVITGSANMSFQAFGGMQRENIIYIDGNEAYDWYYSIYQSLKDDCTDMIGEKAIILSDLEENVEQLPVFSTVQKAKTLIIEPDNSPQTIENVKFFLDVNRLSEKLKPLMPKAEGKGRILLAPTKVKTLRTQIAEDVQREKIEREEYPQLVIDIDSKTAELNGTEMDLSPDPSDIGADVSLFLEYMNGFKMFHGDIEGLQCRYYEFANWFFCSPFMAVMRDLAERYNQSKLPYPVFGLIYGQSKAGKTSFLETLLKMMIGQKTRISAPEFTRKTINGLKQIVKGAPIIADDLTNTRFNQHAIETIKNDDFGVSAHNINYPAVVISANEDVKAVAPEVIRRTVICRVQAGLTNTEVMKNNLVRRVQKDVGTAFYREYLRRMFDIVPSLAEDMKDDSIDSTPDILERSSEVICDIFNEYSDTVPSFIRKLSLEDYFSEKVTGKQTIKIIQTAWRTNRKAFTISKANNELRYNAGQSWDAERIMKELPETLEAHKINGTIIMRLDAAKEFFVTDFKRSWFPW